MWNAFYRRGFTETDDPFYSHRIRWENTAWSTRFLAPQVRASIDPSRVEADVERAMPDGWRTWRPLARAQMIEIATFLSPYLLSSQGDRVAMGHGVEVRYPFLDPDVVAFCAALPDAMKLRGLRDKVALRAVASRHLPPDVWQRPKQPYRAPTTAALFGAGADDYVQDLLATERLADFGLVDPAAAQRLIEKARRTGGRMNGEREEMALVGLLTIQVLASLYTERFDARVEDLRRRLDGCEPDVLEDRSECDREAGPERSPNGVAYSIRVDQREFTPTEDRKT
jgi:asparagine synthase (glutamine-hydrolysing)